MSTDQIVAETAERIITGCGIREEYRGVITDDIFFAIEKALILQRVLFKRRIEKAYEQGRDDARWINSQVEAARATASEYEKLGQKIVDASNKKGGQNAAR